MCLRLHSLQAKILFSVIQGNRTIHRENIDKQEDVYYETLVHMDPKVKMTHDIPLSICSYRKFICYSFQPKSQISRARGAKVIGTSMNLKIRGLESGALKV